MSALPIDSLSLEAPAFEMPTARRSTVAPRHARPSTTREIAREAVKEDAACACCEYAGRTIVDLVAIEEDLTYQAHLGDLHPAHAERLAAVSTELDRRWSTFA